MLLSSGLWKAELVPCKDGGTVATTDAAVVVGGSSGSGCGAMKLLLFESPYSGLAYDDKPVWNVGGKPMCMCVCVCEGVCMCANI